MQLPNIEQMDMRHGQGGYGHGPGTSHGGGMRHHEHHHGGHHHHGGNILPGAGFIAGGLLGSAFGGHYPYPYHQYPNMYYPYMYQNMYPYHPYMQNPNMIYTINPM